MIVDALIVGFCVSLLAGGRLRHLAEVPLRHAWLAAGAALLQYGGQWLLDRGLGWVGAWGSAIYLLSLASVLLFLYINRHLAGFWLAGIGVLLNAVVIAANGGSMPVSPGAMRAAGLLELLAPLEEGRAITHALMSDTSLLGWLGDIIPLPPPYPRPRVVSVGDVVLAAGAVWFLVVGLRPGARGCHSIVGEHRA